MKKLTSLKVSFIEILNAVLTERLGVQVKKDCSRLEGRIRRLCSQTHSKLKGLSGEAYNKLCNTVREFKVRQGELLSITEVESDLKKLKVENEALKEENISLLSSCESLYTELQKAVAQEKETQEKFQTVSVDLENLKKENSHLHQYLDKIEEQKRFANTGGKILEVKGRQQRCKLRELKTSVEKSLWFAKTLGLKLDSACFKDDNGENYKLDYSSKENPKSFKDLPDEEQEKVKCVLFLTDKFCISDSAYHELTMTTGGDNLPRSYLIKQSKENLNQAADTFGVLGISFLLVLTNGLLVTAFGAVAQRTWPGKKNMAALSLAMGLICLAFVYGHFELANIRGEIKESPSRKIAVIQANISQDRKWDKAFINETIDRYSRLSLRAVPCDLVVWPETALPFYYGMDPVPSCRVDTMVRKAGTFFLIGIPAAQPSDHGFLYYNRACMLSPLALPMGYYDKHHLVPFGEYVPFEDLLWFAEKLTAGAGDFSKGTTGPVPLKFGTGTTGVLICFEILFPDISRDFVRNGAEVLTTMTNDAWFGRTQAALQHFSISVFRAVENRRSVVRVANTGISGFVDPSGAILEKTDIFTTCTLTRQVPVFSGTTLYTRHGDFAAKACLVAFLLIIVIELMRKKIRRFL